MPKSYAAGATTPGRPSTILECDVRHVRMPSVLQLVEAEMYTGRITLTPGGVIAIRSGAVVGAVTDSGLNGVAAMRELFLFSEGVCRIELDSSVEGKPLASTISLILDGCKLLDEWNELEGERLLFTSHATMLTPDLEAALAAMRPVLDAMQAGHTLRAAVSETLAHRSAVVPQVMRLIEAGVVDLPRSSSAAHVPLSLATQPEPAVVSPPPLPVAVTPAAPSRKSKRPAAVSPLVAPVTVNAAAPVAAPAAVSSAAPAQVTRDAKVTAEELGDLDELVTRARNFIRSNKLDDAERLLRAAIERNPNDRVLAQNMRHLALRRMQQPA